MAEVSGPAEYLVDAWCHIDVAHCSILLSCSSDTVGINMFMPITMHFFCMVKLIKILQMCDWKKHANKMWDCEIYGLNSRCYFESEIVTRWMSASMLVDPICSASEVYTLSNGESRLSISSGLLEFKHWVVVSMTFYFHPFLGKRSYLTNIVQIGLKPPTRIWVAE